MLHAEPDANILHEQAVTFVQRVVENFESLQSHLEKAARRHADDLYEAHRRVRTAARRRGVSYQVKPAIATGCGGYFCLSMDGVFRYTV